MGGARVSHGIVQECPAWEEEIKLLVPSDAQLEALMADLGGPELFLDQSYVDIYLDSSDRALLRQGLALRLRTQKDKRWLELKGAGTSSQGMNRRPEWRQAVPLEGMPGNAHDWIDGPVRREVLAVIPVQTPLMPLFTCDIQRQVMQHSLRDQALVEIALDLGEVRAEGQTALVREMELELLAGPSAPVFVLANDLARRHGLTLGTRSKFFAGLLLLGCTTLDWT